MIDEAQRNRPHTVDSREVETKRAMPRDVSWNKSPLKKIAKKKKLLNNFSMYLMEWSAV